MIFGRNQKRLDEEAELVERAQLIEEVRRAQQEWSMAQWRFHEALGHDQVDYAIFTLEAAEKKMDMLLRKTKALWRAEANGKSVSGETLS